MHWNIAAADGITTKMCAKGTSGSRKVTAICLDNQISKLSSCPEPPKNLQAGSLINDSHVFFPIIEALENQQHMVWLEKKKGGSFSNQEVKPVT